MQIGRRLYFDLAGNSLVDTGERWDGVVETTVEQDLQSYSALEGRIIESLIIKELGFGENAQDFMECNGFRLNVATNTLEFSYPDPSAPQDPPVYRKPLTVEIAEVKAENAQLQQQLAQVNTDFVSFTDFYFAQNPTQA